MRIFNPLLASENASLPPVIFQPLLPLLHAGHSHGPWDRFVEVLGLLGILALILGVLVLPICIAIYFLLAKILLDRGDQAKSPQDPTTLPGGNDKNQPPSTESGS